MLGSVAFGILLLVVVVLWLVKPWAPRCPQCGARRDDRGLPLCPACGWIYEVPGEEDDDYGPEEEEPWNA